MCGENLGFFISNRAVALVSHNEELGGHATENFHIGLKKCDTFSTFWPSCANIFTQELWDNIEHTEPPPWVVYIVLISPLTETLVTTEYWSVVCGLHTKSGKQKLLFTVHSSKVAGEITFNIINLKTNGTFICNIVFTVCS